MTGPTLPIAEETHATKYRQPGEDFRESQNRLAAALKEDDEHWEKLREILLDMRFLFGGRVQASIGATRRTCAHNCLSGGTKILTREHGAVCIEDVAGKEVTLLDGNGDWILCPILCHGQQKTYALTFKGGYEKIEVRSTLEHGWIANNKETVIKTKAFTFIEGRRSIDDLRPNNFNVCCEDYDRGIIHGLMYGDGTRTVDGAFQIRVCSHHDSITPWLSSLLVTHQPSFGGDPTYRLSRTKSWTNLKKFPSTETISNNYLLGFLRGWFAADGCVSTQPEATLCAGHSEMEWLTIWGPVVGWHVRGYSALAAETNFGKRKKQSLNIRLKKSSMNADDFLIAQHRKRWLVNAKKRRVGWRVHGKVSSPLYEEVYCPVVSTTHSFALACGIHSANCFVSGEVADNFTEKDGIMARAVEAAQTMRMGGGIGYDFSALRPRGARIASLDSASSGPVSFMEIYDAVGRAVSSAGHRRGAQMAVLRIDHPDVVEFIHAKQNEHHLRGFNTSLAVTDEFMQAVESGSDFELTWNGRSGRTVDARALWEQVMRSTWDWAEPGVLFIDRINQLNNLWYCETISATNPCAEQPLPPHGACLLGSFNLTRYIKRRDDNLPWFDRDQLAADVAVIVPAMDNVIDQALYPHPEQEAEAKSKRRMGIGVTGLANALEVLGHPYGSDIFLSFERSILTLIAQRAYTASARLAIEKDSFPALDVDQLLAPHTFAGRFLPEAVKDLIRQGGLRNSHLTSIAPCGTISLTADNVSSGIEPVFALAYDRAINAADGPRVERVEDYGYREWGVEGRTASACSLDEHLSVLLTAQDCVDSAVSKTCNVPPGTPWEDFKSLYYAAWKGSAKGCTTFNVGGKRGGILTEVRAEEAGAACSIDAATGARSCE